MTPGLTYVYCLVRSTRRPVLRGDGQLPGAGPVRALDAGRGVWAIVADVSAVDYDEAALAHGLRNLDWVTRRALAHEGVVARFLRASAVLPMQLFTLFTSDARVVDHVASERRRIDRLLTRLAGQVEWGLRLSVEEGKAVATPPRAASGTAYLARKRDLLDLQRVRVKGGKAAAARLYRAMARSATASRRRTEVEQASRSSRLLLDAVFLAPARQASALRAVLRQHAIPLRALNVRVSFTGPWPPYHFVDASRLTR